MKTAVIFATLIASAAGFAAKKGASTAVSFDSELGVQAPVCLPLLPLFSGKRM